MRILAVDYGTKRIGLATGDDQGLIVRAIKTLPSQGIKRDAHRLIECAESFASDKIIIGQPLTMTGEIGQAARRAQKLATQLRRLTDRPVLLWDERLTSKAADQWMAEHGIKPSRRRALRDQIAACLILEDYLSHVPTNRSTSGF